MVHLVFLFVILLSISKAVVSTKIGVNYGKLGNNLPSPFQSIQLIRSMRAGHVKLFDADPETLKLLSGTNLYVTIMVKSSDIVKIASDQSSADAWVRRNVLPYYPATTIRFILVGNEVLSSDSDKDREVWHHLVPAMRRLKNSLSAQGIRNIKISTPLAMDVLQTTFPPSRGAFRPIIKNSVISPLLKFLNSSNSFFFINAYTYFAWSKRPDETYLDFALLQPNTRRYTDPGTGLVYTNLLDQMLDAVVFAMATLGYPNVRLAISETGWPNAGDIEDTGANIRNAAIYNRNLITRLTANPPLGTPARPGVAIPTFIFSLFNENLKPGPGTERHWGLLYPNGTRIYDVDFTGARSSWGYPPLPWASNNRPYKGKVWCAAADGADLAELRAALRLACSQGNDTCGALMPGRECYEPVSVAWHASYAFSSYWAQFRDQGARCYFSGLATETTSDPGGKGRCRFPSVTL